MASSRIVRASKFRHVYAEESKADDHYLDLELATQSGDHFFVSASAKFFAFVVRGGGGKVFALPFEQHGKVPRSQPGIEGHHGNVYDTQFSPFNDNMLATTSTDTNVRLWQIPDGGLTETMHDPVVTLSGHEKDTQLLKWHPLANNVLATSSRDKTVKLWDVTKAADVVTLPKFKSLISNLSWDTTGQLLCASSKDKKVRVFDARSQDLVSEVQAHEGAKVTTTTFLGRHNLLLTCGFTRMSKREMKVWDPRNTSKALLEQELDHGTGVMIPYFDADTSMLYVAGKGDANIKYFEITRGAKTGRVRAHPLAEGRSELAAKGVAVLPKRACDVTRCEVARFVKLGKDRASTVSFMVPRKSESFQSDIFPDTISAQPATTAEAWFGGANPTPNMMSMDPSKNGGQTGASATFTVDKAAVAARAAKADAPAAAAGGGGAAPAPAPTPAPAPAPAAVDKNAGGEVDALRERAEKAEARVAELEAELRRVTDQLSSMRTIPEAEEEE